MDIAAPTLEWVNHASFILREPPVSLICDPWLSGAAFNFGWRLISQSAFKHEDFSGISHIWFSHQHPDHFAPQDLRRIPESVRKDITVLYHRTIDKKVIRFCKSLSFKGERELADAEWVQLSDQVAIQCGTWFDRDSWLAIRTPHGTILNLNDCVVDSTALAQRIARKVGPIRVLLTQFSYAQYSGNAEDVAARVASARDKLKRIRIQVQVLNPDVVIPFASFIYWSNPENFHMNFEMNHVGDVANFIGGVTHKRPVVLYPGDTWMVGAENDWARSASRYAADLQKCLLEGPAETPVSIPFDAIERAGGQFLKRLYKNNPLLRLLPKRSTTVFLHDLKKTVIISRHGLRETGPDDVPDIEMHSESFLFCLKTPWGSNALHVNGRFRSIDGRHNRFFSFFRPADWADHGYTLEPRRLPLLARAAAFRLSNAVLKQLEQRKTGSIP